MDENDTESDRMIDKMKSVAATVKIGKDCQSSALNQIRPSIFVHILNMVIRCILILYSSVEGIVCSSKEIQHYSQNKYWQCMFLQTTDMLTFTFLYV